MPAELDLQDTTRHPTPGFFTFENISESWKSSIIALVHTLVVTFKNPRNAKERLLSLKISRFIFCLAPAVQDHLVEVRLSLCLLMRRGRQETAHSCQLFPFWQAFCPFEFEITSQLCLRLPSQVCQQDRLWRLEDRKKEVRVAVQAGHREVGVGLHC